MKTAESRSLRNKALSFALAGMLVGMLAVAAACSPKASESASNEDKEDDPIVVVEATGAGSAEGYEYMDMPESLYAYDDHLPNWSLNDGLTGLVPRVTTLADGTQIQKVPSDFGNRFAQPDHRDGTEVHNIEGFNNLMYDADNRGCTTACHSMEEAMANATWYHFSMFLIGYNNEQTIQTCLGCHNQDHEVGSVPFKDAIHTLHYTNNKFKSMDGDCQSCHYLDWNGEYRLWDEVKYDLYTGITDVASETASATLEWNQTEITQREDLWFKTMRLAQDELPTDEDVNAEEDFDNWVIKVTGDVANPFEMTLSEMIETFGTIDNIFATACHETGSGAGTIGQIEATGIPMSAIIAHAQPEAGADAVIFKGDDTYANAWGPSLDNVIKYNGMLVVGINGDTIYPEQGYPVRFMSESLSAGNSIKRVQEIHIVNSANGGGMAYNTFGVFKPLMGVLSAYDGQIFPAGETVTLEGYAYAFDEPIVKIEFSFDGGATWVEHKIENAAPGPWVYWTLNLDEEFTEKGAYLVKMRATSLQADGIERVSPDVVNYLYNIR